MSNECTPLCEENRQCVQNSRLTNKSGLVCNAKYVM